MHKFPEIIDLGRWTEAGLDKLLRTASRFSDAGDRIAFLSEQFLGVPYGEHTLIGGPGLSEVLVVNLGSVDCFTFVDYVEAMRRSSSFSNFRENLRRVRYRTGVVSFEARNHFFGDWREHNAGCIRDVTETLSPAGYKKNVKILNRRSDGTAFVPGIPPTTREIAWVPAEALDSAALAGLLNGDYAGIFSTDEGLDVTHVGIIIRRRDLLLLRHASSREGARSVIDDDLIAYLRGTPGLVVFRPRS